MSSASKGSAALRRPNGRLQACDPCYRRKVACDHSQPVCNRCKARNQASECVYLVSETVAKRRRVSLGGGGEDACERQPRPQESPIPSGFDVGDGPSGRSSGFLGSISYSSVYNEARQTLSLLQGVPSDACGRDLDQGAANSQIPSVALQSPTREQCFIVLRTLATMLDISAWERAIPTPYDTWSADAALRIVQCLYRNYSQYLFGGLSDVKLEKMASNLSSNTSKPFSDDMEDAEQWFSQFCGPNLRWESIGLLFTFRDVRYELVPSCGSASDPGVDGKGGISWMEKQNMANVCMGLCIELSRRFSAGNSVLLMTCLRRTALESQISGDASLQSWQTHAQAVSLLTFLGFHADPAPADYRPTFCSEMKRMLAIHTFIMDKVIVFFTGRPPQINRRYLTTPAPLDLEGSDLYKDQEGRLAASTLLDPNGWNKVGKVRNLTGQRARFINSMFRDEIIEIALFEGQNAPLDTILDIRQRQLKAYEDFPPSVVYSPGEVDDLTIPTRTLVGQLLLRLEHLQNIFVLDRLLLKHGYDDNGKLLETSYEMLAITLLFWRRKDRFSLLLEDFSWIVMAFGTSAGGILCMELLNPSFAGFHHLNKEITRSNIIQQLSLLVAFLDWVPPNGPNANLCQNCSSVVQSILDHALNSNTGASWPPTALENIHLDFNFELLDSFDWMRAAGE